ncbi:MAG: stage V sporulation protein AD [Christensenellales bacterium]|jgi:stage V sporulation protein AD
MSRVGRQSFLYENPPLVASHASVVGPKEGEGPLGKWFDMVIDDDLLGKKSWEQAESEMLRRCALDAISRAGMTDATIDLFLSGDLNDQIIASSFCARSLGIPFVGLYGACSTFAQAMVLAAALISGGQLNSALCGASSHFCTAERQFRFPLEMGTQRTPSAQWTATAAGCAVLKDEKKKDGMRVTAGTIGKVIDYQIKDANHMGAAMAPAVSACIKAHFEDTARPADYYDLVATGDLGWIGRELLIELLHESGLKIDPGRLIDCGASLYAKEQDPHAGASGCGCVASVSCGWLMKRLAQREYTKLLVVGSGAMLSPTSGLQGESIPSIAYAAALEMI